MSSVPVDYRTSQGLSPPERKCLVFLSVAVGILIAHATSFLGVDVVLMYRKSATAPPVFEWDFYSFSWVVPLEIDLGRNVLLGMLVVWVVFIGWCVYRRNLKSKRAIYRALLLIGWLNFAISLLIPTLFVIRCHMGWFLEPARTTGTGRGMLDVAAMMCEGIALICAGYLLRKSDAPHSINK